MKKALIALLISFTYFSSIAQQMLGKVVSIHAEQMPTKEVLALIGKKGNFQFSYKSDIVIQDKKITINSSSKTVKQLLDEIFEGNFHYTERKKYIILHQGGEKLFTISGYIQNGKTGERISNASIYESQLLASTLTNEQGYFSLQLKNKKKIKNLSLTVSKDHFSALSLSLSAGYDQEIKVPILPTNEITLKDVIVNSEKENNSFINRFLLSSKLRIQNLNIGTFFAKSPIQASFIPSIGTHGLFGAQVVNKFSLNVLGGYTGGVNGMEIGSIFNINKGSVRYFQAAGVFNNVYGNMNGMQVGGIYNFVSESSSGAQFSGIFNIVKREMNGCQFAGISNYVQQKVSGVQVAGIHNQNASTLRGVELAGLVNKNKDTSKGVQLSGLANWNNTYTKGFQLAGLVNVVEGNMKGVQFSGFVNIAQHIKGVQFGIINIADSMDGAGIGLINYYNNGEHKLLVNTSDLQQLNIGFLSGTKKLYSMLSLGTNVDLKNQRYSISYGIGRAIGLSNAVSINPEIIGQIFYLGTWSYVPIVAKAQLGFSYKIHSKASLFAAINVSLTENRIEKTVSNFSPWLDNSNINHFTWEHNNLAHWMGWQIGLRFF